MDISAQKNQLRSAMREAVRAMSEMEMAAQSRAVCERLIGHAAFLKADAVLFFMPMKDECDLTGAMEAARGMGKRVALPRCEGEYDLGLYVPKSPDCLVKGRYGILEPDVGRSARISIMDIGFAAIPGVAFDRGCRRLGRGAGYYDRLLQNAQTTYTAGVGFDCRVVDCVPCSELDVPLSCVMTNKWIFCK